MGENKTSGYLSYVMGVASDVSSMPPGCRATVCFLVAPVCVVFTGYLHCIASFNHHGLVVLVGKVRFGCQQRWYRKREMSGVEGRIRSHHCFLNEIRSFGLKGEVKLREIGRDERQWKLNFFQI